MTSSMKALVSGKNLEIFEVGLRGIWRWRQRGGLEAGLKRDWGKGLKEDLSKGWWARRKFEEARKVLAASGSTSEQAIK